MSSQVIRIAGCEDCPLRHAQSTASWDTIHQCGHPSGDFKSVDDWAFVGDGSPRWCPLRRRSLKILIDD